MLDKDIQYFDVTTLLFIKQGMDVINRFIKKFCGFRKLLNFSIVHLKRGNVVDLEN